MQTQNDRLLVLADSHGEHSAVENVLRWAAANAISDAVFLGDGIRDLNRASAAAGFSCQWKKVRGNNDFDAATKDADIFEFNGHRFFLCHGHRYALYSGYDTLIAAARNMEAEAALFGHLHVPIFENENGILLINPGSIGRPRSRVGPTFAVLTCPLNDALQVQFFRIDSLGRVTEVKY